jgi:hypothetical protein
VAGQGAAGFKTKFPAIAAEHEAAIEEAALAGRGTIYRVRLGPLASEAESRSLCETLRKGAQACVPVIPPKVR